MYYSNHSSELYCVSKVNFPVSENECTVSGVKRS